MLTIEKGKDPYMWN